MKTDNPSEEGRIVILEEKLLQTEKVFAGRVFDVEIQSVALANGEQGRREIVRHHGGACILALNAQGEITLVRQFRSPFGSVMLEVPAGKLEPGEDPKRCAIRELQEETGLTADHIRLLAVMAPSPGYCSELLYIYLATGLHPGPARLDPGEFLTCRAYPLDDLLQKMDQGEIRDAKTMIALLKLDRMLRLGQLPEYKEPEYGSPR